jgi:hypothetical protein
MTAGPSLNDLQRDLSDWLQHVPSRHHVEVKAALIKTIHTALADPPPKPPTDDEIATAFQKGADQEFYATVEALTKYCDAGVELTGSDAREVLYELRRPHVVLDHWGNEKQ